MFGQVSGTFNNLDVLSDGQIGGNLNVGGTVTASAFSGGTITPTSLSLPNGSAAAPPLRFSSSTNSGYFWDTAGTAGQAWTVGGTKKMKLNSSVLTLDTDIKNVGFNMETDQLDAGTVACFTMSAANSSTGTLNVISKVTLPDGSNVDPAIAFVSNTSSGLFAQPNSVLVSANGTQVADFTPFEVDFSVPISATAGTSSFGDLVTGAIDTNSNTIFAGSTFFDSVQAGDIQATGKFLGRRDTAVPSITFTSGTTSGLYLTPSEVLNIRAGGTVSGLTLDGSFGTITAEKQLVCSAGALVNSTLQLGGTLTTTGGTVDAGTNALTIGAITSSGTFSNGTRSMTTGAITSSGTFSNGTRSLTCGSISSSGNFTNGTNSMTTGALASSSISASGDIKSTTMFLAPGTTANSTYTFSGHTDSGMSIGAGNVLNTVAGSTLFQIDPTGFYVFAGTISNIGDINYTRYRIRAYMAADQKLTTGTSTFIAYDTKETTGGGSSNFSWAAGSYQFIAPKAGNYLVIYDLVWEANATGQRQAWVEINSGSAGSTRRYAESNVDASSSLRTTNSGSFIYQFAFFDTIQVAGFQNSGGDLNVVGGTSSVSYSTINIFRLSE